VVVLLVVCLSVVYGLLVVVLRVVYGFHVVVLLVVGGCLLVVCLSVVYGLHVVVLLVVGGCLLVVCLSVVYGLLVVVLSVVDGIFFVGLRSVVVWYSGLLVLGGGAVAGGFAPAIISSSGLCGGLSVITMPGIETVGWIGLLSGSHGPAGLVVGVLRVVCFLSVVVAAVADGHHVTGLRETGVVVFILGRVGKVSVTILSGADVVLMMGAAVVVVVVVVVVGPTVPNPSFHGDRSIFL